MGNYLMGPLGGALGGMAGSLFGTPGQSGSQSGSSNTNGTQSGSSSGTSGGVTNQTSTGATSSTTTPNLSPEFAAFQAAIPGQYRTALYNASKPLLGLNQQTASMGGLNQNYNAANQNLMASLARRGALNSGAAAAAQTGLLNNKLNAQSAYLAQAPVTNAQNSQAQTLALLNSMAGYKPLTGSTTTGSTSQQSLTDIQNFINSIFNNQTQSTTDSSSTTKQKGTGLLGLLGL